MSRSIRVHVVAADGPLAGVVAGLLAVTPGVALRGQSRTVADGVTAMAGRPADVVIVGCEALDQSSGGALAGLAQLLGHADVLLVERRSHRRGARLTVPLADLVEGGASGVVAAGELSGDVLSQALRLIADGGRYVSAGLAADVLRTTASRLPELTRREVQVARLLARGATTQVVARELGIQPKTVKNHTTNLYAKLQVTSREELSQAMSPHLQIAS